MFIMKASIFALVSGYVSLPNILPIQFDSGNGYWSSSSFDKVYIIMHNIIFIILQGLVSTKDSEISDL